MKTSVPMGATCLRREVVADVVTGLFRTKALGLITENRGYTIYSFSPKLSPWA